MKVFSYVTVFLVTVIGITACDNYHEQHFFINNDLDTTISIHFDTGQKADSQISVSEKSIKEIYSYGYVFGSVGVSDERYDDPINNLKIEIRDTLFGLNESLWVFEKVTKYHGKYTIKIDTSVVH
jgi:hypothetical protein